MDTRLSSTARGFFIWKNYTRFPWDKTALDPRRPAGGGIHLLARHDRELAYDQIYHEHLLYYVLHSFQRLLSQFDLESMMPTWIPSMAEAALLSSPTPGWPSGRNGCSS